MHRCGYYHFKILFLVCEMTIAFQNYEASVAAPQDKLSAVSSLLSATPTRRGLYRNLFKRVMDLSSMIVVAPIVVPVVATLALLVSREGGSPFYTQMRVGKGGKPFLMWKLRTMVRDADVRLEEYLAADPQARLEWDSTQKLKSDPRITAFGRFLRRSSMDELPQLWNVFKGEMSLVGPRPMMLSQQTLYPGSAYYALRPGITGHWQTAGRNRTTFEARAEYDAAYEQNVTLMTDAKVIVKTFGVVLNGTGY